MNIADGPTAHEIAGAWGMPPWRGWPKSRATIVYAYRPATRSDSPSDRRVGSVPLHRSVVVVVPPGFRVGLRRDKLETLERALRRASDVHWCVVVHDDCDDRAPELLVGWRRGAGRGGIRLVDLQAAGGTVT